jgi:CheY-like chemotaxis protein
MIMPRLLFVDDDFLTLETYDKIFTLSGYEVLLADSGTKALAMAGENHIDLIILDMRLPHMDGFEMLEFLKANPSTREIPVVMTSANPKNYAEEAYASGAQFYLSKPIYPEQIKQILDEIGIHGKDH